MVKFTTTILKFAQQGEKSGWSYIKVTAAVAAQLKPGNKRTFRVKGKLDDYEFSGIALLPMGEGEFIMALNNTVRKAIGKQKGALLKVQLEVDQKVIVAPAELMDCLADEPAALAGFNKLPGSHRNYFIKWIESAKTEPTRVKRIAQAVTALSRHYDFGKMIRILQQDKKDTLK